MSRDQELVRAVCAGQAGSAEELVGRYRGLAVGLAVGRFGFSPGDAEDVFQDLLARLWQQDFKALRAWRGQGKLSTYLTVIVTRMCLERRRRGGSESHLEDQPEVASSDPQPEALAAERERAAAARQALATLAPRDRLLLTLRFVDECSPQHMAPLLGLTSGACRKAVHDALARLRRAMRESKPELFDESRVS